MIRQAISCDICGAEKQHTNHWFVAYQQAGELRVSGWNSRNRLRADSKHLCGQTCLHKLVDEFFAKTVAGRNQSGVQEDAETVEQAVVAASLAANEAHEGMGSSAKVVNAGKTSSAIRESLTAKAIVQPVTIPQPTAVPPAVVSMSARLLTQESRPIPAIPVGVTPSYSSRHLRAEAWEREREREMRARERRAEQGRRR